MWLIPYKGIDISTSKWNGRKDDLGHQGSTFPLFSMGKEPCRHQACVPKETRKAIQLFQRGTGVSDEVRWLLGVRRDFFFVFGPCVGEVEHGRGI